MPPVPDPTAPARRLLRRPASFVLLLVVLAAALLVGSGVGTSTPTAAQRAQALDARLRCPQCQDESVAQSSASTALAVRQEVLAMTRAGRSDAQIEAYLEARYGPAILLSPPTSGLASLVWFVPLAAGVVALVLLGRFFWRRARSFAALGPDGGP